MTDNKVCEYCNELKGLIEFEPESSICKSCELINKREVNNTEEKLLSRMYSGQLSRSKKRGHNLPEYSRKDFMSFMLGNENFVKLYNDWKRSGYESDLVPSIDRLDESKGYSLDNIRIVTWQDNRKNSFTEAKNGSYVRSVVRYTLEGFWAGTYNSLKDANRQTGVSERGISAACNHTQKTAGGYYWEWAEGNKRVHDKLVNIRKIFKKLKALTNDDVILKVLEEYKKEVKIKEIIPVLQDMKKRPIKAGTPDNKRNWCIGYDEALEDVIKMLLNK